MEVVDISLGESPQYDVLYKLSGAPLFAPVWFGNPVDSGDLSLPLNERLDPFNKEYTIFTPNDDQIEEYRDFIEDPFHSRIDYPALAGARDSISGEISGPLSDYGDSEEAHIIQTLFRIGWASCFVEPTHTEYGIGNYLLAFSDDVVQQGIDDLNDDPALSGDALDILIPSHPDIAEVRSGLYCKTPGDPLNSTLGENVSGFTLTRGIGYPLELYFRRLRVMQIIE